MYYENCIGNLKVEESMTKNQIYSFYRGFMYLGNTI